MAYRIRYQCNVEYLPPGIGAMGASGSVAAPGIAPTGVGFTLAFFQAQPPPSAPTFTATDVTNLLASMTTDLSTQMNAQLTRIQGFATGGS